MRYEDAVWEIYHLMHRQQVDKAVGFLEGIIKEVKDIHKDGKEKTSESNSKDQTKDKVS